MCNKFGLRSSRTLQASFPGLSSAFELNCFFGASENAVKSQIWIAVSVYVIIAIIRNRLHIVESLRTILQIIDLTIFEKPVHKPPFHREVQHLQVVGIVIKIAT